MALVLSSASSSSPSVDLHRPRNALPRSSRCRLDPGPNLRLWGKQQELLLPQRVSASNLCVRRTLSIDGSSASFGEFESEEELCAAVRLRTRTFYEFRQSVGVEDHRRNLAEREFAALKERISGEATGFWKVTCVNATLPLAMPLASAHDLCSICKFSSKGEDRVVIGTLDVNQCSRMADELAGKKPEGTGADIKRAYLTNFCVAEELQRNGFGYALISKSKKLAKSWGITDLYVHVAVDNEAAKRLYEKCGFSYESEEPAWQARFLGRPRRYLLWTDLSQTGSV